LTRVADHFTVTRVLICGARGANAKAACYL
jgi:hypothetical protein